MIGIRQSRLTDFFINTLPLTGVYTGISLWNSKAGKAKTRGGCPKQVNTSQRGRQEIQIPKRSGEVKKIQASNRFQTEMQVKEDRKKRQETHGRL